MLTQSVVPFAAPSEAFSVRSLSVDETWQGHIRCITKYYTPQNEFCQEADCKFISVYARYGD